MIDNSKLENKPSESTIPGMIASMAQSKMDTSKYKVRVDRFDLDSTMDQVTGLEKLYTRGIDGSGDVVILKEKTFTDNDVMIVVVTYMEKRLGNDPSSVLKNLRESEE